MSKQPKITQEDFQAWKDNPITQSVIAHLGQAKVACDQVWLKNMYASQAVDPTVLLVLRAELRAKVEFIEDITNLELGDIQEDDDDSSNVRPLRKAKA